MSSIPFPRYLPWEGARRYIPVPVNESLRLSPHEPGGGAIARYGLLVDDLETVALIQRDIEYIGALQIGGDTLLVTDPGAALEEIKTAFFVALLFLNLGIYAPQGQWQNPTHLS